VRPVLALAVLFGLTACPAAFAELAAGSRSAGDGWTVQASVESADVGPLRISVGPIRRAPVNDAHPWLRHALVIENTGSRPVTITGLRTTGALLGPRRRPMLVAAGQGCGWTNVGRRLEIACLAYLDVLTVGPHDSLTLSVTLWKGLRGLAPLRPGTYVFRTLVHFRIGRAIPEPGTGRTARLRIVYRVDTR
jgi:hypothetical protein